MSANYSASVLTGTQVYTDYATAVTGQTTLACNTASNVHQISLVVNGSPSAGSLGVEVMPHGTNVWMALSVNGVAVSMSMTSNNSFGPFDGSFKGVRVTPTGFNGTSFDVIVSGS